MLYGSKLNAFRRSLFELSEDWNDLPLRDGEVLRLQLVSEKTAMRMYVEAYIVLADRLDEDEEPEWITVALYNRDDFMLDALFLLSGYPRATAFVSDVIGERQAIVVYDRDGDWGGSKTIRPAQVQIKHKPTGDAILALDDEVDDLFVGRPIRYIRSWIGTYDWR
jgi:hypothetical protein